MPVVEAVARILPSAEKATAERFSRRCPLWCLWNRRGQKLLMHFHQGKFQMRTVDFGGGDRLPSGRAGLNTAVCPIKDFHGFAISGVPEAHGLVVTGQASIFPSGDSGRTLRYQYGQ